jgi:HK97 family phage prohead protease
MPATTTSTKRRFSVQVKDIGSDGSFEAVLASYNTDDLGGDRILPGAFAKTIREHGSEVPLLWQHKSDRPIGTLNLIDGPDALRVKGQLLMELPDARNAYSLIKARVIKGMSIGYDTIKDQIDNGIRLLKEVRLWEGSIVTFPMNEAAMITSVKSVGGTETKDDFNTELSEIQLQDAGYQMRYALFNALGSVVWASGLTKEDKVAAAKSSIDQFAEAYLTYFPQYLDWLASVYGDMEMMGRLQMEEKDMGAMLGRSVKSVATMRKLKAGVISINEARAELKEGRKFSADTMKSLKAAHGHVKDMGESCKSLDDIFGALFDDEADDPEELEEDPSLDDSTTDESTSKSKAAPETKTEPVDDHSEEVEILSGLRSLLRGA